MQLALRQRIGSTPIDELLKSRHDVGQRVLKQTIAKAEAIGVQLQLAEVKDFMFPGDLKKIFAQVVQARQEGLASLERARGETAALRNLENAASMLQRNPALMQLRLLQTMGESSGHTVGVTDAHGLGTGCARLSRRRATGHASIGIPPRHPL